MRKTVLVLATTALGVLLAGGAALALPSETPDETPMVNGPVRTFAQVPGTDLLWVGGNFTQVKERDGTVIANVSNVAVFDLTKDGTAQYVDIAPRLGAGSTTTNVRDIALYGNDVVIGGDFPGPTTKQRNLVVVDGSTGGVVRWFNSQRLQSVLAAPDLGRVYGGGNSLSAFDFATGKKLWTRARTTVDPDLRPHNLAPGYRDLERAGHSSTIWAACGCDTVAAPDGTPNPAKALVKLDTEGDHAASWRRPARAGGGAFGISVAQTTGTLYLGAGGTDFVAAFSKADGGRMWRMDTSGSTQVVEKMDGQLVVGGHFVEVADQAGDSCGRRSSDPGTLDPNDECQTRKGLAAYSFNGTLDPSWDPPLTGKYNLAWALHPEGTRLHVGGEFTRVSGIRQEYYARLSNAQAPPSCTVTGTSSSETLTGTSGDDVICGGGGSDILRGLEGHDILEGEAGNDKLFGGAGDDDLNGGIGTGDTANFSDSPAPVAVTLADGTAAGEGYDVLSSVEKLTGSGADDTLTGSEVNNTLNGGSGADTVVGLGGADVLKGTGGDDSLDSRDGLEGNDTVNGGGGTDTCTTDATEKSVTKCEQ